jgi:UTP--glucose-1-phosphate uridylyltransferase
MNTKKLEAQLADLSSAQVERLQERGFDPARLRGWASTLDQPTDAQNRVRGKVEPLPDAELHALPQPDAPGRAEFAERGAEELRAGALAVCVLAGGMATRMGGVVKALVEAVPGKTFLDLRLAERARVGKAYDKAPPLWLMTSEATDGPIRAALGDRHDGSSIATFEQNLSLRLTPSGELFLDADSEPSVYATGHGDLPDALRRSGLLDRFVAGGGRWIWISNLDNVGALEIDPAILGWHMERGAVCTCELADKRPGDKGGGPVLRDGKPIICEHFRLPRGFDGNSIPVFNTNTFLVDAVKLQAMDMDWTYVRVDKAVGGRNAVQFERLIGEMTETLKPSFLRVPRDGAHARFIPVKDKADLAVGQAVLGQVLTRLGL